jgi:hypothetical protein
MRRAARWTVLSFLCLFGTQQGQAQPECGGDYVCIEEAPAAAIAWLDKSPAAAKLLKPVEPERCPGAAVDVAAASPEERHLVCSAANHALQLLGRCGISLRWPLQVQILTEVRHPFSGAIFGLFDTKQERVLVTREANRPALVKDTPYAALPQRDFYRSLIVHEVIHGVMHQNLKRPATSHAAYEYPAYALQMESLAPDVRDQFLRSFDQAAVKANATLFSDAILFFDPYFFAARAYEHFKSSPDGCAHIRALLEGEVAFIAPQM